MAKKVPNQGKRWTSKEVNRLLDLVSENTPTRVIALKLGRTPKAIYSKAGEEDVSLKPTNQAPYNRRKK
ncbi:MAG: hypothetical protein AB1649_27735 [Chloroflexota bacterium]